MAYVTNRDSPARKKQPPVNSRKAAYDIAYHRARRRALEQLAREHPDRMTELVAAHRSEGADSPQQQAARRAVLYREAATIREASRS